MATINKTGEWIYLVKDFALEVPLDRLGIWYAKPKGEYLHGYRNMGGDYVVANEMKDAGIQSESITVKDYVDLVWKYLDGGGSDIYPKRLREDIEFAISLHKYSKDDFVSVVEIITPFGPITIFPEEYNPVDLNFAMQCVEAGSHIIRYMGNDGNVRDSMKHTKVTEQVFYLRSRGVKFSDAMRGVSGDIKSQHFLYFDPLPQYVDMFSRDYPKQCEKKMRYCLNNDLEHLLHYKVTEGEDQGEFTLADWLKHIEYDAIPK